MTGRNNTETDRPLEIKERIETEEAKIEALKKDIYQQVIQGRDFSEEIEALIKEATIKVDPAFLVGTYIKKSIKVKNA